jgi:hypothetical protein
MRIVIVSIAICLLLLSTTISGFASLDQFAGYWTNVDPNTGGTTALEIAVSDSTVNVHAWGKCHPSDCDWGTTTAYPFAPDVSSDISNNAQALLAIFDAGFSETTLVIKLDGDNLQVDNYDRFKDNSGRSNYLATYTFQKGQAPGGVSSGGTPAVLDLTGVWDCDDGGKYYIRQLDSTIWWYGEKDPNTPEWSNVMYGTLSGDVLTSSWSDVPKGSIMQYGSLTLKVNSADEITATDKTGGFAGSHWTRAT